MEHLKNHNKPGFLLMEVLLTIALVGLSLSPAFLMQSTTMRSVFQFSNRIRLLFPVKNFFFEKVFKGEQKGPEEKSKPEMSRQISRPAGTVTYKTKPVGQNSALKNIKGMQRVEVVGRTLRTQETLIGFIYKPEREKK